MQLLVLNWINKFNEIFNWPKNSTEHILNNSKDRLISSLIFVSPGTLAKGHFHLIDHDTFIY